MRDDPEWLDAAAEYLELGTKYDELGTRYEEAKTRLAALATHAKEQGGGVSVAKFWKRGNVDYKRVPELAGVDLEAYRAKGREEIRVSCV